MKSSRDSPADWALGLVDSEDAGSSPACCPNEAKKSQFRVWEDQPLLRGQSLKTLLTSAEQMELGLDPGQEGTFEGAS